jgi:hypothetical protein
MNKWHELETYNLPLEEQARIRFELVAQLAGAAPEPPTEKRKRKRNRTASSTQQVQSKKSRANVRGTGQAAGADERVDQNQFN